MSKKFQGFILVMMFVLGACGFTVSEKAVENLIIEASQPLIIVGEGGTSKAMFIKAAQTYKKQNQGVIYEVHNGDEFVTAVKDFLKNYGKIKHLEYFGHGNHVGLYVNQQPGVNGALYVNDPDQNKLYKAASFFELESNIFAKNGWIRFNGCNVAGGDAPNESLAQKISNYFDVDVVAPLGPTEFSRTPNVVNPIENSQFLSPNFDGEVYMVPTYSKKPFIVVKPQRPDDSGFSDLRIGQDYQVAAAELIKKGLDLGFKEGKFLPYKNVTNEEAVKFCRVAPGEKGPCVFSGKPGEFIRNLKALKMLLDAAGVKIWYSNPWHKNYIWWANQKGILTRDFVTKKWFTRGEMAQLSWNLGKAL